MISAASYPPLYKTQGRGTHSFITGREKPSAKGWATRLSNIFVGRSILGTNKLGSLPSVPVFPVPVFPQRLRRITHGLSKEHTYDPKIHSARLPLLGGSLRICCQRTTIQ